MSTPNLARVALGALDANKGLSSPGLSPKRQLGSASFKQELRMESTSPTRNEKRKAEEELQSLQHKRRGADPTETCLGEEIARQEAEDSRQEIEKSEDALEKQYDNGEDVEESSQEANFSQCSDSTVLNDSQLTNFTEPDSTILRSPPTRAPVSFSHPISPPATPEELRSNAAALRLRLKVAMYKVQTNQIALPLSRLEVRHSPQAHPHPRPRIHCIPSSSPARQRRSTVGTDLADSQNVATMHFPSSPPNSGVSMAVREEEQEHEQEQEQRRPEEGYAHQMNMAIGSGGGSSEERLKMIAEQASRVTPDPDGRAVDGLLSLMSSAGR